MFNVCQVYIQLLFNIYSSLSNVHIAGLKAPALSLDSDHDGKQACDKQTSIDQWF